MMMLITVNGVVWFVMPILLLVLRTLVRNTSLHISKDIDFYIKNGDEITFNYGGAKGMYHADSIAKLGGHPVLNGQLGSLWINLT